MTETRVEVPGPEAGLRAGGAERVLEVARAVKAGLAAGADRHDREGSYAPENIDAVWAAGLGNLTLPAAWGGVGAGLSTTARAVQTLAEGDASTALILVMHLIHLRIATAPDSSWPEHLCRKVVESSLAGPALINALRVEPELGTPARGGVPATRAVRAAGPGGRPSWRLHGHKIYTTGSFGLRWLVVWAATEPGDPDGQRMGSFLVPGDAPGLEVRETWDHLGMRASASHDVLLHDVEIPLDHAIDLRTSRELAAERRPQWLVVPILAVYAGVATAARAWLLGYLNERTPTNLGAPLATLPRFQAAVGEIDALLHANERLLFTLAEDLDRGGDAAEAAERRASLDKVLISRNVIRAVEIGLELIGNPGLSYHHPLQRHYRDALCSRIHTPQDDTVLTSAGQAALEAARG